MELSLLEKTVYYLNLSFAHVPSKYFKNYQSWFSQEQTTSKEVFEFVENLKKSQIGKFELTRFLEDYQEVFFDKMHIEFTDLKAKNVRLGKFLPIINECVISIIKKDLGLNLNLKYDFENFVQCYFLLKLNYIKKYERKELFVDEIQDYSVLELELFKQVFINSRFNYYGDLYQSISGKGLLLSDIQQLPEFVHFSINENYRNALEITELVNKEIECNIKPIGLNGTISYTNKLEYNGETMIVVVKDFSIIQNVFKENVNYIGLDSEDVIDNKINIFDICSVKGLEFDTVYVYDKDMLKKEKYIAYTRALSNLIIVK